MRKYKQMKMLLIQEENEQKDYYMVLKDFSIKLQNRVSDIIKYLGFTIHSSEKHLDAALAYYQSRNALGKTAPSEFLTDIERKLIHQDDEFDISLYKAVFFVNIVSAIKSGSISLIESYRYMPIEAYLIDDEIWQSEKNEILEKTGLTEFKKIETLLEKLKSILDKRYFEVNKQIKNGKNSHIRQKKGDGFTVHTPAVEKPDYEPIVELLGNDQYIPILQMISEANSLTKFTTSFKHHKLKDSKTTPKDEVLYAGIFALGSNIGLYKLASSAVGISYNTLSNATNWYFSLENLHAANNMITNFMNKLWLPSQFKKEQALLPVMDKNGVYQLNL
jgi:hypothetical protein